MHVAFSPSSYMCATDYRLAAVCATGRNGRHRPPACTPTAESPDVFFVARINYAVYDCAAAAGAWHASRCSVYALVLCGALPMLLCRHHLAEVWGWENHVVCSQTEPKTCGLQSAMFLAVGTCTITLFVINFSDCGFRRIHTLMLCHLCVG